jgi:large subunit ribosomal protein L21
VTYAIFKAAGFQYRAELGDVLRLPSLEAESGDTVTFDEVLLGAASGEVMIGRPRLEGAAVRAQVLRHGRADKIIVFKFKRRKNYRRKTGHRQDFTEVRVSEIDLGGKYRASLEEPEEKPVKKAKAKKEPEAKAAAPEKKTAKAAPKKKAPAAKKTATAKTKTATAKTKTAKAKAEAKPKASAKKATGAKSQASKPKDASKSKKKKS